MKHLTNQKPTWSAVLVEKLTFLQPVNKFPEIQGFSELIKVFRTASNFYLSWVRKIQSTTSQPMCLRSILTLSSNVCLSLPNLPFHYGYWQKSCVHFPSAPHMPHALPFSFTFISILYEYMARNINCKSSCYAVSPSYCYYYPFDPRIFFGVLFWKTLGLGSSLNTKQQNVWGH